MHPDLEPFGAFAEIIVPDHVVARVRERLGWTGGWREIRVEVRLDLIAERLTLHRPNWTRGDSFGGASRKEPIGYAYNADATRCWVLVQSGSRVVVKTLLTGYDDRMAEAQDARLRAGMVRR